MIGRTLSHYRILDKLGAGGMGEVYRARDEKLGRDVAIKVLPAGLLGQQPARERFHKEALALSRLSHPHIATLLDFDRAEGDDFLAMELVEGKTLVEALGAGPLPEKDVVRLGTQLARGLQAAHEHGVVHRDLKPGNLALTADGLLKILDFGLARLEHPVQPGVEEKTASTDTAVGRVAGTPAYMPPEQLLGKPVDARTDVYGAGACLYEMVAGRRPFGNKSGVELTDAVLHETPVPPRMLGASVSPGLESVIVKCLDKDPGLRYQTAKELLVDLERLQAAATSGTASQPVALARGRRRPWPWLVAAAVVAAVGAAAWLFRPAPPPRIVDIRRLTRGLEPTRSYPWTLTTDGPRVYFTGIRTGSWGLFQIPVTGGEQSRIPLPFSGPIAVYGYSPAESLLLVGTEPDLAGWPLWMVPTTGGAPRRVGDLRASPLPPSAALSPDGRRIAVVDGSANRLIIAGLDGTVAQTITPLPDSAFEPQWSPDGRRLRLTARGPKGHGSEFWKWEVTLGSGTAHPLWEGTGGAWTPDGRFFVFVRTGVSWYTGDLYAATETPAWRRGPPPLTRLTFGPHRFSTPTLSSDGRRILVFGEEPRAELLRWEATRQRFVPFLGGESAGMVDASRDGRWLAWVSFPDGILWRSRRDGSDRLQLSSNAVYALCPRWSPDGTRIVYPALGKGDSGLSIHVVPMTGGADAVLARPSAPDHSYWDPCWLPDGRTVLFSNLLSNQPAGIHRVEVDSSRRDLVPGSEDLKYPKCGPQGQILGMRVGRFGERVPSTLGYAVLWPGRGAWEPSGLPSSWSNVNWSRDGRFLYGLDLQAGRVQRFAPYRRTLENVADPALPLTVWVNVPWFGLDSEDAPLLMADRSTREIYALDWETP